MMWKLTVEIEVKVDGANSMLIVFNGLGRKPPTWSKRHCGCRLERGKDRRRDCVRVS